MALKKKTVKFKKDVEEKFGQSILMSDSESDVSMGELGEL